MTEDGHILNCFVRQTILYMTIFGHIISAFFNSWDRGNRQTYTGHQILYCLIKKKIKSSQHFNGACVLCATGF